MFVALIIFEWGNASRGKGTVHTSQTAIAKVNGQEISLADFDARVKEVEEYQRQNNPTGEINDQQIRDQVWQQMIDEELIRQKAEQLGIVVSDDELREAMLYDPPPALKQPFTDSSGVFHQEEYFSFMGNARSFLSTRMHMKPKEIDKTLGEIKRLENGIRLQRIRDAVQSVVASGAIPSPLEARAAFDEQKAKATGIFASLDFTSVADSLANVTDAEAKKYYDDHKADFQQKASREVHYVMFQVSPAARDSATVNKNLKAVTSALATATTSIQKDSVFQDYQARLGSGNYSGANFTPLSEMSPELQSALQGATEGSVIGPVRLSDGNYLINLVAVTDSGEPYVKAQHILLKTGQGANDDSVKALADKVYQRAKSGEKFETLVQQYSGDQGSVPQGGDVGYFKKGKMVKEFEEAAFAAPVGTIVGPVKTQYGYHIIKVNERSSKAYKLRDIRFNVKVSNITKQEASSKAAQFREQLLKSGKAIDTVAEQQKLQPLSAPVDRTQPTAGSMKLTNFAYDAKPGDISEVLELQNGGMIVAQLAKVHNAGVMEFEDAKQTILTKLRIQKKLDILKSKATQLRASLQPGDSLTKLATQDPSVQVRMFTDLTRSSPFPGVGFDYALANAVFNLKLNQLSDLIRGERAYYIVNVSGRTQPTDQEYNAEKQKFIESLIAQRRQTLFQDWLQKEREHATIEDFRGSRY